MAYKLAPPLLLWNQDAFVEEVGALEEVLLEVAYHTLDGLEVALDAVEVAFHMGPLEEDLGAEDLHTS